MVSISQLNVMFFFYLNQGAFDATGMEGSLVSRIEAAGERGCIISVLSDVHKASSGLKTDVLLSFKSIED